MTKSSRDLIWDSLKEVALADGILSKDEQELMATIVMDLEKYNEMLQRALEDDLIDVKEEKELFEGRMRIMEKAYSKAREDMIITDDEKQLLKEICRVVRDLH